MTHTNQKRYAIYYSPERGTSLYTFGQIWLGRNIYTGAAVSQPRIAGFTVEQLKQIVSPPAVYGFHGTLKPPFHTVSKDQEDHLVQKLTHFALQEKPFFLPGLVLAQIGRFLALVPEKECEPVNELANRCVEKFDYFRQPASLVEIKRRRTMGLTPLQEGYLQKWGYPFVMDAYRFHLTLTGALYDQSHLDCLRSELNLLLRWVDLAPIKIDSICLFVQPEGSKPFLLHSRYYFGS